MVVQEGELAESSSAEELVKYTPRVGDVGALVERYSISEFTYHTWRNPMLDARYRAARTGTTTAALAGGSVSVSDSTPAEQGGATALLAPATSLPAAAIPATSIPATSLPATSLPATSLPATSLPATSLPATSIPATSIPASPAANSEHGAVGAEKQASLGGRVTSWAAAAETFASDLMKPLEGPPIQAAASVAVPAGHRGAAIPWEESMKPEQTWATLQPPTHPVPVPLIRWTEPEDLMNRPLPILASLPDVSSLVQQLAQRPRRVMAAQVQTLHPAEAVVLASLNSLPSERLTMRPHLSTAPAGRVEAAVSPLNGHRGPAELRGQRPTVRPREAAAGQPLDSGGVASIPQPAPQELPTGPSMQATTPRHSSESGLVEPVKDKGVERVVELPAPPPSSAPVTGVRAAEPVPALAPVGAAPAPSPSARELLRRLALKGG